MRKGKAKGKGQKAKGKSWRGAAAPGFSLGRASRGWRAGRVLLGLAELGDNAAGLKARAG
jgi:hypothetical protein